MFILIAYCAYSCTRLAELTNIFNERNIILSVTYVWLHRRRPNLQIQQIFI